MHTQIRDLQDCADPSAVPWADLSGQTHCTWHLLSRSIQAKRSGCCRSNICGVSEGLRDDARVAGLQIGSE